MPTRRQTQHARTMARNLQTNGIDLQVTRQTPSRTGTVRMIESPQRIDANYDEEAGTLSSRTDWLTMRSLYQLNNAQDAPQAGDRFHDPETGRHWEVTPTEGQNEGDDQPGDLDYLRITTRRIPAP